MYRYSVLHEYTTNMNGKITYYLLQIVLVERVESVCRLVT